MNSTRQGASGSASSSAPEAHGPVRLVFVHRKGQDEPGVYFRVDKDQILADTRSGQSAAVAATADMEELKDVEAALNDLAPLVLNLARDRRRHIREGLLRQFLGDVSPTPLDIEQERLRAQGLQWVYQGTQWLTADEVAMQAQVSPATVNRWKTSNKVFAIQWEGRDRYPRYAFGTKCRPLAEMARILATLRNYSPERLAAWFESTSSFLDGHRPREVLADNPQRAIEAADFAVEAEQYPG
jgi:hypothetical protein